MYTSGSDFVSTNHTYQATPFSFEYLWPIAVSIYQNNSRNSSLFHPQDNQSRICLTYEACVAYVGTDYTLYSRQDVYDRIILWRIPLIALVFTTTLPALGFSSQAFTIFHLIADPIDTLWSLFYRLHLAQRHAEWASTEGKTLHFTLDETETVESENLINNNEHDGIRRQSEHIYHEQEEFYEEQDVTQVGERDSVREPLRPPTSQPRRVQTLFVGHQKLQDAEQDQRDKNTKLINQYDCDVIALIVDAYQEWDFGGQAKAVIRRGFIKRHSVTSRQNFHSRCSTAAAYIAADRVSRDLPSFVATLVFFTQVFAAFWKTLGEIGDHPDPSNPSSIGLNRTPHDIAFGALYFWLPFAVLGTAYVGGAQTENSVPRILTSLRRDTEEIFRSESRGPDQTEEETPTFPELQFSMRQRWLQGGIPTWQLNKFEDWGTNHRAFLVSAFLLSIIIVVIPSCTALLISWNTPAEGFGCRATTQISFLGIWFLSLLIDLLLSKAIPVSSQRDGSVRNQSIFWITLLKDIAFTVAVSTTLTYTAIGVYNSCDCWTKWWPNYSNRYLSFPQEQFVFDQIKNRLRGLFLIVTFTALLLEVAIFALVAFHFRNGHRVLKQRDIEYLLSESWWTWLGKGLMKFVRHLLPMKRLESGSEQERQNFAETELVERSQQSGNRSPNYGRLQQGSKCENRDDQDIAGDDRSSTRDTTLEQGGDLYQSESSSQRSHVRIGSNVPTRRAPPLPPRTAR